ncbi:hypothetical protein Agabi119p4_5272 [Agaricus bisporus var. burnettii]|uniref:Uncharacterized protein n=2 Tax=Agaricus bisporus var. burnettii TaxID=192524 RepID=A0A8H7F1G2_AGABI|nr:hypothetical protein Agabi119p4_5272 [Agaricus bisporus var. burnettii]
MSKLQSEPLLSESSADAQHYGSSSWTPPANRKKTIGFFSVVFIIFNRIIGTGIFATPAAILSLSGSVGLSLLLWILGSLYAAAGMQVYIVWGTAIPKNGAEKNYLEYLFPRPALLVTCLYAGSMSLIGWAAGNSLVFGEYILKAFLSEEPSPLVLKFTAFLGITLSVLIHGSAVEFGLRVQNVLGVFKLIVLAIVAATGFVALQYGIPSSSDLVEDRWRGHENFRDVWQGSIFSASSMCLALYSVLWSFVGFSNANYALSEVRDPARTIRLAGPLAVAVVAALYLFTNIAYFASASKQEIMDSGRLVVALLMKNIWGEKVERWVDFGVACSSLGSVLAMVFAQGRINQELGKEGVLPWSKFWASNRPFDAPLAGHSLHWFICVLIIFFAPAGDAYNLVINLASWPLTVVNAVISFGLIYLYFAPSSRSSEHQHYRWHHQSTTTLICTLFFGIANVFLFIAPLVKPPPGAEPYERLPYWTHAAVGWALFGLGGIWWVFGRRRNVDRNEESVVMITPSKL